MPLVGLKNFEITCAGGANIATFVGEDASPRVGIGTTNPQAAKLHVISDTEDVAVRGVCSYGDSFSAGVRGESTAVNGVGVWGIANNGNTAVAVFGSSIPGYAGWFSGRVKVTGTLEKPAGSFKIDHPLDPANKYLSHSFVESPDMMNIYNGNIVTDAKGYAEITLPVWFEALNRDFRYQLTVLDDSGSDEFVQVKVAKKVQGNRFTIRSSSPAVEVSWQVTGIRHDAYAEAHRIVVEEDKPVGNRGKYDHPELFGRPPTESTHHRAERKLN
jgi:hypothetical protein